jgi:hypothetical protein
VKFHRDRLIAALNKHWRPLSVEEYLHEMDVPATSNAVTVAEMSEALFDWIWEPQKRDSFSMEWEQPKVRYGKL